MYVLFKLHGWQTSNRRGSSTRSRLHCVGHESRVWVGWSCCCSLSNGIAWVCFSSTICVCVGLAASGKFYYLHYLQLCDVWWRLCVRFPKYYSQFSVRSPLSLFVCRTMSVSLIITGLVISHTLHSFEWNSSGNTISSIYLPNTLSKIRF